MPLNGTDPTVYHADAINVQYVLAFRVNGKLVQTNESNEVNLFSRNILVHKAETSDFSLLVFYNQVLIQSIAGLLILYECRV